MGAKRKISRREFLARTATAVGAGLCAPYVLTSDALGGPGRPPASDRIISGHVGVGGRGQGFLRADTAAVCDVDEANRLRAVKIVESKGGKAAAYLDYRELLDRKDIDVVFVASPDHWHGLHTVHACEAGKDVYCEKPASKTIEEGRTMVNAAKRYGRIVQVGSQGRSTPAAHAAAQYIRNGQIGKVQKVTCWHYENPVGKWEPDTDPPPGLDWDRWLGPCPWVPYNPLRCHFNFRWFMEYGAGNIRDRGAHVFSNIMWAMDCDNSGPVSVEATGEPPHDGLYDCPVTMEAKYEFKNPDWILTWSQPGHKEMDAAFGCKYWGDKDTLVVTGGDGGCGTEEKAMQYKVPPGGVLLFKSPGHERNFFDCVKSREQPLMHIEAGHRTATLCIIGNISYLLGRKLYWDPVKEQFTGDEEANRLLSRNSRAPYFL